MTNDPTAWKVLPHVSAEDVERWVALHPYAEWKAEQDAKKAA